MGLTFTVEYPFTTAAKIRIVIAGVLMRTDWCLELVELHIGYATVEPLPLLRLDTADATIRASGLSPKARIRADRATGTIILDSEATLIGITL